MTALRPIGTLALVLSSVAMLTASTATACVLPPIECRILNGGAGQQLRCIQSIGGIVAVQLFAESPEGRDGGPGQVIEIDPGDVEPWPPLPEVEVEVVGDDVTLRVSDYHTFGSTAGEECACALSLPGDSLASLDSLVALDGDGNVISELPFAPDPDTGFGFDALFTTGSWYGFSGVTSGDLGADDDVVLEFRGRLAEGATRDDLVADLEGSGVALGTDAGDGTGAPSGDHTGLVPLRVAD